MPVVMVENSHAASLHTHDDDQNSHAASLHAADGC